jgi:acetate kinase
MKILVLNAGSSSMKYSLFNGEDSHQIAHGLVEHIGETPERDVAFALRQVETELQQQSLIEHLGDCDAVGHRVVHGGEDFQQPVIVTESVMDTIDRLSELAPLHNPANLAPMRLLAEKHPGLVQTAVFDTAFHQSMPAYVYHYAIPKHLYDDHLIRRYGFHGTSHQYIAKRAATLLGKPLNQLNIISMHLGNGASVCAIQYGKSMDTSMGFTPLEGLVMGTRCGDLDPSIPLYMMRELGYSAEQVDHLLNKESGLLGLAGQNDMRELMQMAYAGDENAGLALKIFIYRLIKVAGSYMAIMDDLDAIVFTGGIGEHADKIRYRVVNDFSKAFGFEIDPVANVKAKGESCITRPTSRIPAWVIPTDEEKEIAQQTLALLSDT